MHLVSLFDCHKNLIKKLHFSANLIDMCKRSANRGFFVPRHDTQDVMNRQVYEQIALFTILFAVGIAYASCLHDFAIGA